VIKKFISGGVIFERLWGELKKSQAVEIDIGKLISDFKVKIFE